MNRFRLLALGFVTVFLLLALGTVFFIQIQTASHTVSVWIIKPGASVSLGSPYAPGVVERVTIKAQDNDFNYTTRDPGVAGYHFLQALQPGDIVREDDVAQDSKTVALAVSGTGSPDLLPGAAADVFAQTASGQLVLLGHGIPVISGGSGSFVILVSTADEADWVAISVSKTPLVLIRTVPGQKEPERTIDLPTALCKLNVATCSAPGASGTGG